jgi:hypothetical protein
MSIRAAGGFSSRLPRIYLTNQRLTNHVNARKDARKKIGGRTTVREALLPSRQQQAAVGILRTTAYLLRCGSRLFHQHGITSQQYSVLRILRRAGPDGLPTLGIVESVIEQTPGMTRLQDRLEANKLERRERPSRRQCRDNACFRR